MSVRRIIAFLSKHNGDRPFIGRLFRNYESRSVSIIVNTIVGFCCFILLVVGLFGLFSFFKAQPSQVTAIVKCLIIIFCVSFLLSVKYAYNLLFSSLSINFGKSLPLTPSERYTAEFLYLYKRQLFISICIVAAIVFKLVLEKADICIILFCFFLSCIVPIFAVLFAILISYVIKISIEKIKIRRKIYYCKDSCSKALLFYEFKNLFSFPTLILELLSELLFFTVFTWKAVTSNNFFLCFIILFPSLSMINQSSFSREGKFYELFCSFPISRVRRILPKMAVWLVVECLPLLICFFVVVLKKSDIHTLIWGIPLTFYSINIGLMGLFADYRNPKIYWENPAYAFSTKYSVVFKSLLLGLVSTMIYYITNFISFNIKIIGFCISIVLNVVFLLLVCKRQTAA